jgi:hypothetical protein
MVGKTNNTVLCIEMIFGIKAKLRLFNYENFDESGKRFLLLH